MASSPRRTFLKKSALAAAVFGAAAAAPHATGQSTATRRTGRGELLDARDFGATGDGKTDDLDALREVIRRSAETAAAGVHLPAGTYLISGALHLPSNFRLTGAGRGLTVLKAAPGTLFPKYKPDPRTADIRQRRTMITMQGVSSVRERLTRNVSIERLTVDWSHCPTGGFGHSAVLMDSVDHGKLLEVAFVNCMPSDHPPTAHEVRAGGGNFRCECVMYSNARHGLMERCFLTDSGYRPLSVSYGSLDIVFRDGVIYAEKPVWRHAFSENHGDGIVRDENFVLSQLIFQNSTFILEGGTPGDGVCSHTGTTVVENCDFYIRKAATGFFAIVRAFDGSRNCIYTNNRFHCLGDYPAQFSVFTTTPRTSPSRGDNEAIVFSGNLIDIRFGKQERPRRRALIQLQGTDRRARITENHIRVQWSGPLPSEVIRLEENATFSVTGNLVEISADTSEEGPHGIVLDECRHGRVEGNVITGDLRHGIKTIGGRTGVVIAGNSLADASGEAIVHEESGG